MSVVIPPDITIVGGGGGSSSASPFAPRISSISQASGIVIVGAAQSPVTGSWQVSSLRLYRAPSVDGPWTAVDTRVLSTSAIQNFLFDPNPTYGSEKFYQVTAIDAADNESAPCPAYAYTAFGLTPSGSAAILPASAFGPYPLLGQDVFLSPLTREAVIGPNGDLLTVNGLECWAQDLRMRIESEPGELPLHPEWGLGRSFIIGSGQARPTATAQSLKADIMDAIRLDPRTLRILEVIVAPYDQFSWTVSYEAMAIGVEDPLRANLVWPYYKR